jgi:cephalosporin hydroxylase
MIREFNSSFGKNQLQQLQSGILHNFRYKDVPCLKNPTDLAIYLRLIWDAMPQSIIEIGSKYGGSALFFADVCKNYSLKTNIFSIDLYPPDNITIENIKFIQGDANDLNSIFLKFNLYKAARPWLVIEDSAHTYELCLKTLDFFSSNLSSGEYLVIEDGILDELGLSEKYNGGPNRAIKEYLENFPDIYEIAEEYCDMFGTNLTYNPNGYLKRR